jgi:type IV pilus assembly protein PilW
MKNKLYQTGLSLIEIMIALLIGAFLLGGVLQIFIGSKQTYRMQENLSRLQENGRLALDFLANDIRMAGYQGCPSLRNVTPNVIAGVPVIPALTENTFVSGAENIAANWNANACGAGNVCIANTDAISLIYSDSCGGNLNIAMADVSADIKIPATNSCSISANKAVLVSNCSFGDIFRAINDASTTVQHPTLNIAYGTDAELFIYRTYSYFIRESTGGFPGRSLWRLDNTRATSSSNPVELIEGIENMQIFYGVDTDAASTPGYGSANYYVPANNVANIAQVVSIRITLTARTIDGNLTTTGDGRIRRDFTSTIGLRNRLP